MQDDVKTGEATSAPDDFSEFEKWSAAQDEREPDNETPDAPAVTPPAKPTPPATEPEKKDPETPESKTGMQKRFDKLTKEIYDLKAQLVTSKPAQGTPGVVTPPPAAPPPKAKPVPTDFETYEDYTEELTDWKIEQSKTADAAEARKAEAVKASEQVFSTYHERVAELKKTVPDFDDIINGADIPITYVFREAIMTSDHGPELAHYLALHEDECKAIAALSDVAAVRALGKLEAKFDKPPVTQGTPKPPPPASKAPKPPAPVEGRASTAPPDIYDEDLAADFNKWERAYNKAEAARNR